MIYLITEGDYDDYRVITILNGPAGFNMSSVEREQRIKAWDEHDEWKKKYVAAGKLGIVNADWWAANPSPPDVRVRFVAALKEAGFKELDYEEVNV